MSALGFALLIFGVWTALGIVTLLALLPLLRVAGGAPSVPRQAGPATPPAERTSTPQRASAFRESGYLGIVLERLALHATTIFGADQVCLFGRDPRVRDDRLVLVQGTGVNPDLIGRQLDIHWDPMVAALACGRPLAVPGHLWPVWETDSPAGGAAPVQSAAMAPVWFGGRLQGAIGLTHRRDGRRLDIEGLARLGRFAELAGQALAHTHGRELSVADPQPEIDGLLAALERRVPGSALHGDEVALLALRLAEELGAGGADLLEVELAARLSRVGTIRMPAPAPDPAAAPTDAEGELLRLEPLWGADMVARVPGLEAVALIVRHTRERWDGGGHPDGLAGERIPLAARLIAAAEARCGGAPVEQLTGTSLDPQLAARIAERLFASAAR
jgi:HD-GYP domain-containing protein (c-di-GMP phosphodiesterase class II)